MPPFLADFVDKVIAHAGAALFLLSAVVVLGALFLWIRPRK